MTRKQKLARDKKTVREYKKKLKARRKEYVQSAEVYSATGRKYRALALGECAIQLYEKLRELDRQKTLLPGTLFWNITEDKVMDTDNKKGFHYQVAYYVKSNEPYYTQEEIDKEIEDLAKKLQMETDEMFPEEPAEAPATQEQPAE